PIAVRHHRNTRADLHHMTHTLDSFSLCGVEARHLSAEHWAALDGRDQHSRNFNVNAVDATACYFLRRVYPGNCLADEAKLFRRLELGLFRDWKRCGLIRQLAVGKLSARRLMGPHLLCRDTLLPRHAPLFSRSDNQHLSGRRACAAPKGQHVTNASTAVGGLLSATHRIAEGRVCRSLLDADFRPLGFQFVSDDHGNRCHDALAHLRLADADGHGAVSGDADPGIKRSWPGSSCGSQGPPPGGGNMNPQQQAAACRDARFDKTPPAQIDDGAHFAPPWARVPAARWMARRMR